MDIVWWWIRIMLSWFACVLYPFVWLFWWWWIRTEHTKSNDNIILIHHHTTSINTQLFPWQENPYIPTNTHTHYKQKRTHTHMIKHTKDPCQNSLYIITQYTSSHNHFHGKRILVHQKTHRQTWQIMETHTQYKQKRTPKIIEHTKTMTNPYPSSHNSHHHTSISMTKGSVYTKNNTKTEHVIEKRTI